MAQQNAAANGIGAMATNFLAPQGEFHVDGEYGVPASAYNFPDAKIQNTQYTLQNAQAFGAPLPQGMGMMAGLLPAALKIEEHKKMNEVAEEYYKQYIKDFNTKYGFTDPQIKELAEDFQEVTEEICNLIPDADMKNMYRKYIQSYPTMYLSMIPAEALQMKFAVKCVTDNKKLRQKVEDMSSCMSSLVKNLTELQISAGIPPIVNLMFESMPDPLTAMTDSMYHKYNESIVTYHKILKDNTPSMVGPTNAPPQPEGVADHLRREPVHFLKGLSGHISGLGNTAYGTSSGEEVTQREVDELVTVMTNMQTQSGCQPFGDEWNHTGPTPPMNPAMCLAEGDNMRPGNPRHNVGRTTLYQAKRDKSGQAHWVQNGNIPALSGQGNQMVQIQPSSQNGDPWAGVSHMPGVDNRPVQQQMPPQQMQMPSQQMQRPSQQMLQPPAFQNPQAFTQDYEIVDQVPHQPIKRSSKGSGSKKSKDSKKSKKS